MGGKLNDAASWIVFKQSYCLTLIDVMKLIKICIRQIQIKICIHQMQISKSI